MTLTDRHQGQAATIAADTAIHRRYAEHIRMAIDAQINLDLYFTADDVRGIARSVALSYREDFTPAPNLIPAILGGYARAGRIVRVTDVASTRRSRHGSRIGVWRAAR